MLDRAATAGKPADLIAGERAKSALRGCGNADSSFEEPKPASHPFFADGFHGTCCKPAGFEPACFLSCRSNRSLHHQPSLLAQLRLAGQPIQEKLSGERSSRTLILREDASCPVRTLVGTTEVSELFTTSLRCAAAEAALRSSPERRRAVDGPRSYGWQA